MSLKAVVSEDDFGSMEESLKPFYVKEGDSYVLDTDTKDRIKEFRNNNIKHVKEVADLRKQLEGFDGIDPDEYKRAVDELQGLKDKKLIDENKIDELLAQRTERMRQDYEAKFTAIKKTSDADRVRAEKFEKDLTDLKISSMVRGAIDKVAVPRKGALMDIMSRANKIWSLDDNGNPIPMVNGKVEYGSDGNPLTIEDFVLNLVKDAPHLFEDSKGSSALGSEGFDVGEINAGVLKNPNAAQIGSKLEDIASGKLKVIR